jgi:hypothetical protein
MSEPTGKQPKKLPNEFLPLPYWVEIINDLVIGAGFSYSRIAYRIRVSPSTIQKLATNPNRKPRHYVFHALLCLYFKVFQGQHVTTKALAYWNKKQMSCKPIEV